MNAALLAVAFAVTVGAFPASSPIPPTLAVPGWTIEVVGLHGGSAPPDLGLDSSGTPHVLYCPPGDERYATRTETGWEDEHVVFQIFGGVCGELAFGPGDMPHVTTPIATAILKELYGTRRDDGTWDLAPYPGGLLGAVNGKGEPQVLVYEKLAPNSWAVRYRTLANGIWVQEDVEIVPTAEPRGAAWASMVLDETDQPHLLYYDSVRGDVRYAFRDDTGWHVEVVEHTGILPSARREGSLALAPDGTPHAAYSYWSGPASFGVRYTWRSGASWTFEDVADPGSQPAIGVDRSGGVKIAYEWSVPVDPATFTYDTDVRFAERTNVGWAHNVVFDGYQDGSKGFPPAGNPPDFPTMALDGCGNPHVAFYVHIEGWVGYATKGGPCAPEPQPRALKQEAIQRIKTLKERALDRTDWRFVENLDAAERSVWKSLGYVDPFRPLGITASAGADVLVARNRHDRVDVVLGPSWTPRLLTYDTLRIAWGDGDVTAIELPGGWPRHPLRYHDDVWVDAWEQDLSISSNWNWRTGRVMLTVRARDASLGFTLSLDADPVATLSFPYSVRPWWIDGSHLDPKHGHKVFELERKAVDCLVAFTRDGGDDDDDDEDGDRGGVGPLHMDEDRGERGDCRHRDDDEDDHDDGWDEDDRRSPDARSPRCRLTPRLWSDAERAELDAECAAIADLLVSADEGLALAALGDAKDTPVADPRNQDRVDREIARAERDLARGREAWSTSKYDEAIRHFERAWEHAQRAIRLAGR